jgi:apolipoprotein N-acyltransferase
MDPTIIFEGVTMSRFGTIILAVLSIVLFVAGLPAASFFALAFAVGVELVALKRAMDEQRAAQALRPVRITRTVRQPRRNRH